MSTGNSNSSGQVTGQASQAYPMEDKIRVPKEQVCDNPECFSRGVAKMDHVKFCSECGGELVERLAEMYIDLCFSNRYFSDTKLQNPSPIEELDREPAKEQKMRVSMRDMVRFMKEYEKEVFVEGI